MGKDKKTEKLNEKDVGLAQDLIFALKNLTAAEDHCEMSFKVTGNPRFKILQDRLRRRRSTAIKLLVKKNAEAHEWCITKHLLNVSIGFTEVANRFNQTHQDNEANFFYMEAGATDLDILELNDFSDQKEAMTSA